MPDIIDNVIVPEGTPTGEDVPLIVEI